MLAHRERVNKRVERHLNLQIIGWEVHFMKEVVNQSALGSNREGRLAPTQFFNLLPYILIGMFLFLLGAGLAYGAFFTIFNLLVNHVMQNGTIIGILLFGGLAIMLIRFAWSASRKTIIDLVSGKVVSIDGPTRKYTEAGSRSGRVLYYSVGTLSFQIPSSGTWEALPEGSVVRAYYTPNSGTFVNAELLSSQASL
jgi:hypothetical protein